MRKTISKDERSRPSSRKRIADALRTVRRGGTANQAGRAWGIKAKREPGITVKKLKSGKFAYYAHGMPK